MENQTSILTINIHLLMLSVLSNGQKPVVFLMHGFLDASHTWVFRIFALILIFKGY